MPDQADIERFIASTFRSVWDLELLLELKRSPGDPMTRDQLVSALRASDVVVSRGVETLVASGLAAEDSDGSVHYAPAGPGLDELAAGAVELYRSRPDSVRRLIIAGIPGGLAAFSDAFRIKGDK